MSDTPKRPGGAIARRPLHFIMLLDVSGSMQAQGKIQALNNAIRQAIPTIRDTAERNVRCDVLVRVLTFATTVQWHTPEPVSIHRFTWTDLIAGGETSMGAALVEVATVLRIPPMDTRALPPVLLLISDGRPTDGFTAGLETLMGEFWGENAVRTAIAIGKDADLTYLNRFIGNTKRPVLSANNPDALARQFRAGSTNAIDLSSSIVSEPLAPPAADDSRGESIW